MQKHAVLLSLALVAASSCADSRLLTETDHAAPLASMAVLGSDCSVAGLIQAIEHANSLPEAIIDLFPGCKYELTDVHNISPVTGINGLPVVTSTLTINGNGAEISRSGEAPDFRILYIFNVDDEFQDDQSAQGLGNLTVNNLIISGGDYSNSGGGVANHGGTLIINNSTIRGNSSGDDGGGLHNAMGTVHLNHSFILNNTAADDGGGLSNYFGEVTINDSVIEENSAGDSGGVVNVGGTLHIINNTVVAGNTAEDHGGGVKNIGGTVHIANSSIAANEAQDSGGGLSNEGTADVDGTVYITNSTISGNKSSDSGGGLANGPGGRLIVIRSSIVDNEADEDGGGVHNYGGTVEFRSSTISNNEGKWGGGLTNESGKEEGSALVLNTTISQNAAREGGGGIFSDKGGRLIVEFSTISHNTPPRCRLGAGCCSTTICLPQRASRAASSRQTRLTTWQPSKARANPVAALATISSARRLGRTSTCLWLSGRALT